MEGNKRSGERKEGRGGATYGRELGKNVLVRPPGREMDEMTVEGWRGWRCGGGRGQTEELVVNVGI